MKRIIFFTLVTFTSLSIFSQSSTEEKIWSRVEALTKAVFETKDSMMLKSLVSENLTYGHSGGNLENKQMMVTGASTSPSIYKDRAFEKVSINVHRKSAIVRHNFKAISVDTKGVETPLNLAIMQAWKKENGKWKLWARQAVKVLPKS